MPPPSAQVLPEAGDGPLRDLGPEPAAAGVAAVRYPSAGPRPAQPDVTEHPWAEHARAEAEHARAEDVRDEPQVAAAPAAADDAEAAAMPDAGGAAATAVPRRPVLEEGRRTRGDVPWLGIGSWLLLCGALFASLVGWPDQAAVDRLTSVWSTGSLDGILARTPEQAEPTQMAPRPAEKLEAQPPAQALPPVPAATADETAAPADGPPVPRFKPRVDRVAAEFSSAFFEIGERLQRQGDFAAALHMRRQGSNLDPWKGGAPESEHGRPG